MRVAAWAWAALVLSGSAAARPIETQQVFELGDAQTHNVYGSFLHASMERDVARRASWGMRLLECRYYG